MKQFWDLIQETLGPDFAEDHELQETVRYLSTAFTEAREELPADYLSDPEIQRAYLAYYVPLNFEKVRTVLSSHAGVWPTKLTGPQRWVDLGAGPATAVLAAMASLRNRYRKETSLPHIQIDLIDTEASALETGSALISQFAKKLELDVSVNLYKTLAAARNTPATSANYDLALAANVLNELPAEGSANTRELLMQLWDVTKGVLLVLEPGHRVSSQRLVRFRERLLKDSAADSRILGPCMHQEKCPVNRTKNWCHFAEPTTEGRLIDLNLRIFKNARAWLKFSYLLVKRGEPLTWSADSNPVTYRAVGDLHPSGPGKFAIDLCRPSEKFALRVPKNLPPDVRSNLVRGAMVQIDDEYQISARAMTKRNPLSPSEMRPSRRRDAAPPVQANKTLPKVKPKRR